MSLLKENFLPFFKCFPFSKFSEKWQIFYCIVLVSFFKPFSQAQKFYRSAFFVPGDTFARQSVVVDDFVFLQVKIAYNLHIVRIVRLRVFFHQINKFHRRYLMVSHHLNKSVHILHLKYSTLIFLLALLWPTPLILIYLTLLNICRIRP